MRAIVVVVVALVTACGVIPAIAPSGSVIDDDHDGIADLIEDHIMKRFGPELRLAPDGIDWARPANVEWYLERVRMRFDHGGCSDDRVLALGDVTSGSIHAQRHPTKRSAAGWCRHRDDWSQLRVSSRRHLEFFLQPAHDRTVHAGIPAVRADEWTAYVQVRPSGYVRADGVAAAYDLQVWYFFPYNDSYGAANHEGDWEHLTISLDAELGFVSVYFATHGDGQRVDDPGRLRWVDETHLVAYVADGSHATYPTPGSHWRRMADDHCYEGGPVWRTWHRFENLGQPGRVLGAQTWAMYGGRWGEVGTNAMTSGPPGPMFNKRWDTRREY